MLRSSIEVPSYHPGDKFNGLAFVAQSPGKNEILREIPMVGATGKVLSEDCEKAGIEFEDAWRGNVVGYKPPANDFAAFCGKKDEVGGKDYPYPPIDSGMYLRPEFFPELERLGEELTSLNPTLIVALGREALWALTGLRGITKYRGTVLCGSMDAPVRLQGIKILPTFHPASIFRTYQNRIYLTLDLFKARSELSSREIKVIDREIHVYPESPKELWNWLDFARTRATALIQYPNQPLCSVDIEDRTAKGKKMIECIGFAFSPHLSLVVPFWSDYREGNSYWRSTEDELEAWKFVEHMLRTYPLLGQNFVTYDTWVLWKEMNLRALTPSHDTMIQHHAFQPELRKGLGILSSIYCNVPAYKTMKPRGKKFDKRDE